MPPSNKTVTLTRTDGTKVHVSPEQAERLKLLGYKEETPEERGPRLEEAAKEDYYSQTSQQISTGVEGFFGGATLGLTDYFNSDPEAKDRAKYNPGIRTATEILGGVGTEFIPGVNLIAPAAAVGRGARAVVKGGGFARGATRGAMEGVVYGGAAGANHAFMAGDPVTSEAVLHGMGWGALFGAGLGGVGGSLASRGEKNIAAGGVAVREGMEGIQAAGTKADDLAAREVALAKEGAFIKRQEAELVKAGPKFEVAPGSYRGAAEVPYTGLKTEAKRLSGEISDAVKTTEAILTNDRKAMAKLGFSRTMSEADMGASRIALNTGLRRVFKAMDKGKGKTKFSGEKLAKAIDEYEAIAARVIKKSGLTKTDSGASALMEHARLKVIQKQLDRLPHTAEEFAKMSPKRAEDLFAALEEAKGLSNYKVLGSALEENANRLQEALGMSATGVSGLRKAWEQAGKLVKGEKSTVKNFELKTAKAELAAKRAELAAEKAGRAKDEAAPKEEPGIMRKIGGWGLGYGVFKVAAGVSGHPLIAAGLGHKVRSAFINSGKAKTPELMAAKSMVTGRIKQAVGNFQLRASKGAKVVGRSAPYLAVKLDGSLDETTKDPQQLALNRIEEFSQASVHVKNTLYKAVERIAIEQPELGPALHNSAVSAFSAAFGMLPSNPGVVSRLKSIWKPSAIQAAIMAKQLEVFHDPVGSAEYMLYTGEFDPIKVKALKEVAPATYDQLRVEMISRIQSGLLDKATYKEQVAIGIMLDIPIHSSMKPEYIAASQALHFTRNQPLPTPAQPGAGSSGGGRPSPESGSGGTAAQITTHR